MSNKDETMHASIADIKWNASNVSNPAGKHAQCTAGFIDKCAHVHETERI